MKNERAQPGKKSEGSEVGDGVRTEREIGEVRYFAEW
jgi:hypothetical protein